LRLVELNLILLRAGIVKMPGLCSDCLRADDCDEVFGEKEFVISCDEYVKFDEETITLEGFNNYVTNLIADLGSTDPLRPAYRFGGVSNA